MNKLFGVAGVGVLLLAGVLLVPKTENAPPPRVSIEPAFVVAEGKVEALPGRDVHVGAELTGRIEKVFVKEGDLVRKGQVIARLESRDILAKLREAEAEMMVAQA